MSKSALQASNTSVQSVLANGSINVGSPKLRFGKDICLNNGSIVLKNCGYYSINQTITIQPTAIGEVAVKLQHNGADILGAISYGYATEASQNVTLNVSAIVKVNPGNGCPCENLPDTITTILVDVPGDVVSVLTDVVKL